MRVTATMLMKISGKQKDPAESAGSSFKCAMDVSLVLTTIRNRMRPVAGTTDEGGDASTIGH
jgi:hypothetical protein